jgi:hypothetical protein
MECRNGPFVWAKFVAGLGGISRQSLRYHPEVGWTNLRFALEPSARPRPSPTGPGPSTAAISIQFSSKLIVSKLIHPSSA